MTGTRMTSPDLHSLLDRVRNAAGPSRELDAALAIVIDGAEAVRYQHAHPPGVVIRDGKFEFAPPVSSSLDAVVALIEEKLPVNTTRTCSDPSGCSAQITWWPNGLSGGQRIQTQGASDNLPLALLDALLQALIEVHHDEA